MTSSAWTKKKVEDAISKGKVVMYDTGSAVMPITKTGKGVAEKAVTGKSWVIDTKKGIVGPKAAVTAWGKSKSRSRSRSKSPPPVKKPVRKSRSRSRSRSRSKSPSKGNQSVVNAKLQKNIATCKDKVCPDGKYCSLASGGCINKTKKHFSDPRYNTVGATQADLNEFLKVMDGGASNRPPSRSRSPPHKLPSRSRSPPPPHKLPSRSKVKCYEKDHPGCASGKVCSASGLCITNLNKSTAKDKLAVLYNGKYVVGSKTAIEKLDKMFGNLPRVPMSDVLEKKIIESGGGRSRSPGKVSSRSRSPGREQGAQRPIDVIVSGGRSSHSRSPGKVTGGTPPVVAPHVGSISPSKRNEWRNKLAECLSVE